jgi:FkbM family methyltransferase
MSLLRLFLRWLLRFAPKGVAIAFFRYSRNLFSVPLNRWLEDNVFPDFLKGRSETLDLPRLVVPIAIERRMNIRVGDESQRSYWIGAYDDVAACVLRHLRPTDTFVDIGANCGFVTLLASSVVPADRLWCFEPNPDTYRELAANLRANGLAAHAYNLGLSDAPGHARLFVPEGACGGSSIDAQNYQRRPLQPGETLPTRFHEVELVRFDDLWSREKPALPTGGAIVVKLDAEGHERKIIDGMQHFLRTHRERVTLLVEVYECDYDGIVAALGAHGLVPRAIASDGSPGSPDRPEPNRFKNYCFQRAEEGVL